MLNVEPSNLVFLKTYNIEFDKIIITFEDQNHRPLETEDKINLTLPIDRSKWNAPRVEQCADILCDDIPRTRKYVKGYGFLSFAIEYKKLWDAGLNSSKDCFQKISP